MDLADDTRAEFGLDAASRALLTGCHSSSPSLQIDQIAGLDHSRVVDEYVDLGADSAEHEGPLGQWCFSAEDQQDKTGRS